MPLSITTTLIRDGANNLVARQTGDVSGTGAGPKLPLMLLATADGLNVVDLQELLTDIADAVASGASVLPTGAATDAALASILAKLSADPATQTTLAAVLAKLNAGLALTAGAAVIGKIIQQVGGSDVSASNPVPVGGAQIATATATIASGTSLSSATDLGTGRLVGIIIPAAWTTAAITFQGSADGVTYFDLYDDAIERTIASGSVVASRFIALPIADWLMVRAVKIRSGSAASPVNQPADRIVTLVTAR